MNTLRFTIAGLDREETADIALAHGVIAGWTGRDQAAMNAHAAELAELGVPRPSAMPLFYRVAASRVTCRDVIEVCGEETGGEAEPVLVQHAGVLHVGIGSDHTDRALETYGVALSKQVCDKPLGATLWRFDDVCAHWEQLILRAWITEGGERRLYQEGALAAQRPPQELIARFAGHDAEALADGTVMFCGTVPAIGGVRPTPALTVALEDPVLGRTLTHSYTVQALPIVA